MKLGFRKLTTKSSRRFLKKQEEISKKKAIDTNSMFKVNDTFRNKENNGAN